MTANVVDDDAPLPLPELRDRVNADTYAWLQAADRTEQQTEIQQREAAATNSLFETEEENYVRVQEWSSSCSNPDGIGGYYGLEGESEEQVDHSAVRVKYILSDSPGGHGDDVWAASRHISNLFADADKCRELLGRKGGEGHPLRNMKCIELGAGAGLPSWTALKCGAKVVCTDQPIAKRIRCMAESAERNCQEMVADAEGEARVCPYTWGSPVEDVTRLLGGSESDSRFDVVVAADCIYMPEFHAALLDSIEMLLKKNTGIGLLPFALHDNTEDDNVWGILDLAKQKGFRVEILESKQLTPQIANMNPKRGLVHTLRLTKKRDS